MPQYIVLPNGAYFEVRKGESAQAATQAAMQRYPEAFEAPAAKKEEPAPVQEPEAGFNLGDTATAFKQGAVGSTKALTDVFGADNAVSQFLDKRNKELQGQYSPQRQAEIAQGRERMAAAEATGSTWEQVKAGVANVAEAPVQGIAQGLGSFIPYILTMRLGGPTVPAALRLGPTASKALTTIANQAPKLIGTAQGVGAVKGAIYDAVYQAEIQDGADAAVAKQKALDAQGYVGENLDQILVGAAGGFAAGSMGAEKLLTPLGRAGAAGKLAPRVAGAMAVDAATEGFQGGQEQFAANKALQRTGRDVDSFKGVPGAAAQEAAMGALAAGPVAVVRGPEAAPGPSPQAKRQEELAAAAKKAEEEKAYRQTPEYAQEVLQRYDALVTRRRELDSVANAPVAKDDLAGQQAKADARKARQELMSDPVTHETVRAFNENKERIAQLRKSPEEFMLEQVGVTGAAPAQGIQPRGKARGLYQPEKPAPTPDPTQQWVAQRVDWAMSQPDMRRMDQGGLDDLAALLLEDPTRAAAYVASKPNIPGMRPKEQTALIRKVGRGLADLESTAQEAGRAGTAAAQLRNQSVEMEEQAFRDEQTQADEELRRAAAESAERSKTLNSEMQALRGMAQRPGPYVPTPGAFAPGQTELVRQEAPAIGQAAQVLSGETRGLDMQFNQDRNKALGADTVGSGEPAVTGPAQRVPGGFRLFNAQGAPDADTGFRPLQQRVARLLASPDLTDEAYQFLRTVEDTMPQLDAQVEEARQGRTRNGPEQDTAGLGSLYSELDTALGAIERGEQGVVTEGAPRYKETPYRPAEGGYAGASATPVNPAYKTDIAAVQAGEQPKRAAGVKQPESDERTALPAAAQLTPTSQRTDATTPNTLRGPSAGVRRGDVQANVPEQRGGKRLEVPRMLQDHLSLFAQARADDAGQQSLFPDTDKERGAIKDSPEAFSRFMNSPFVRTLRKNLRDAQGLAKKGPPISALKQQVDALARKVGAMRAATAEYKTADQILKNAKVLAGIQLDAKKMSARMTELVVDRMQLAGALEKARSDAEVFARAPSPPRGSPVFKTLSVEMERTRKRLELLQAEYDAMNTVLNTLDAQIKIAQASNTLAQKRDAAPFPYQLTEAEEALRGAQASLGLAQSEVAAREQRIAERKGEEQRLNDAVDESKQRQLQEARRKAENKRIEALYGENKDGVERRRVFALSDVQQEARQRMEAGEEPELTYSERQAVAGDPQQVLGGYRARARALEKAIAKKQQNSRGYAGQNVEKLRATQDSLFEQYKAAKSAAERDSLGAKFDVASAALRAAEQRFKGEDVLWPGADKDIKALRDAYIRVEWLEDAIARGDFELRAPVPVVEAVATRLQDAHVQKRASVGQAEAAADRADAPRTSGAPLLKSQIQKLQKQQKTRYQGKGTEAGQAQFRGSPQVVAVQEREAEMKRDVEAALAEEQRKAAAAKEKGKRRTKADRELVEYLEAARLLTRADALKKDTVLPDPKSEKRGGDFLERDTVALSDGAAEAAQDGRIFDVLDDLEENGSTPFVKDLVKKLRPLLLRTKLRVHDGLADSRGQRVEGLYDTSRNTVALDSEALSEEVVIHEMSHAATLRALDAPESELTDTQLAARKRLERLFKDAEDSGLFTGEYALEDLPEFVSELMSNAAVRAKVDQVQPGFLKRVQNALLRLLGVSAGKASDAAVADVEALFQPALPYTRVARADVASVMRGKFPDADITTAQGTPDPIATAVNSVVGRGEQSWWQKIQANVSGMAFRTQFIDAYAPSEALLRSGVQKGQLESLKAFQTMYFLRFGQQRNQFLAQAASTGVPQLKNQGDGTYTYEADEGPNLASIARILSDAGIGDPQQVEGEFTAYLAIRRAGQIPNGYAKLNLKNPMSEAQAKAFMEAVKADPKRSEAFEAAAQEYRAYNGKLLDFLVQTGAMDSRKAAQLKRGDFVPFYRQTPDGVFQLVVMGETPVRIGDIRSQPYLQELMGDDEKILPVFTGAMQNTSMLLDLGLRNQAVKSMAYTLRDMNAGIIGKGQGPQGARAKRDTVSFTDRGEDFFVKIDSEAYGVPAELLLKGLEGIKTTLPVAVKAMAGFSNVLRAGVTRMPAYAFRQLIRDPINAWLTTGGNFTPVLSSMAEMAKMQGGRSETEGVLERGGAISSNVFSGDRADWPRIMRNISANTKGVRGLADQAMSKLDAFATQGDTATRAVLYNMYREKGMSHMEALLGSLESMNFSRRGASPTMHFMSMVVPFFNAQIQGVDVIYRAARGQALFENELDVQRKLLVRGAILTAATLAYAAAMQDDEAYKNASDEERANNFFVYLPGVDEPIKLPIPFELGYAFKAIPELIYNVAAGDEKAGDAAKTLGKLLYNTVPLGMPQALKPGVEVVANYSFYTGQPILGAREQGLDPAQQFRQNTTELAKLLGSVGDVSPVKIDHLVRGYTGGMGLLMMQMANPLLRPLNPDDSGAKATAKLSEMPLIGSLFQPTDGRGFINEAFQTAQEFDRRARTYKELVASGNKAEATAYAQRFSNEIANASAAGSFRQRMGEFAKYRRFIQGHQEMGAAEKRAALDAVRQAELQLSRRMKALGKTEDQ